MTELNKFQRIVNRIMTVEEAKERCEEMHLDEKTTRWIVKQFTETNDDIDSGELEARGYTPDAVTGENGRIACGQSWEYTYECLAEAMTGEEDVVPTQDWCDAHPEVERVWEAFFEE